MKTHFAKPRLVLGFLLSVAFGFGSLAYAGTGRPDSTQQEKTRFENGAKSAGSPKMNCRSCKTRSLNEPFLGKWEDAESDAYTFKWFIVGWEHTCKRCGGGAITVTFKDGKTVNAMQHNCPQCGEAAVLCMAAIQREL